MSTCDLRSTTVGWVLHALEPDDERRLLEHLPYCPACRRTERETREVTMALARSVPAVEPPPSLRARVLAAAREEPDRPSVHGPYLLRGPGEHLPDDPADGRPSASGTADRAVDGTDRTGAAAGPERGVTPPVPEAPAPDGRSSRSSGSSGKAQRRGLLAAAAAVLGVVVLTIGALLPSDPPSGGGGDTPSDRAGRVVASAEARDPASRQATLRRTDGDAVAVVVTDTGGTRVVPVDLPTAEPGRAYVLWALGGPGASGPASGSSPVALGTVAGGGDIATVPSASDPATGTPRAFALSVEPAGPLPARPSVLVAGGTVV